MVRKVLTATLVGIHALPVVIEVDSSLGLPGFSMVGLPDNAVRESRERVVSALRASGFQPMNRRITVNLAPADLRKEGSSFDLALAVGLLLATEQFDSVPAQETLLFGELSLDGHIQPAHGVLSVACCARKQGRRLVVPLPNLQEALSVEGLEVAGVETLTECVALLSDISVGKFQRGGCAERFIQLNSPFRRDFAQVQGMESVRRALEIAAAGGHHFLMVGSPGSGKTMCAQCVPGILPPLTPQEAMESTMIHSCTGLLDAGAGILIERPFRAPHHTASAVSLVGGGRRARPGEVSLAHNGLLFLDEFPEFSRASFEALRQPLEDGQVTVSRIQDTITWPARFLLGAAMNPCPCGYSLDPSHECGCTPAEIARYRQRISGPMLDRIDLQIHVPSQPFDLLHPVQGESSQVIADRVLAAVERQRHRFAPERGWVWNARLGYEDVRRFCALSTEAADTLLKATRRLRLSARASLRMLKVARTIADLRGTEKIRKEDLIEAVQYRLPG